MKPNGIVATTSVILDVIKTELGVEAKLESQYDRLQIRPHDRVQSRIDRNNAPKRMVERYANQMGEFEFPPIVVTQDGVTVDGNTRVKAHAQRNERYIPALVVPIRLDEADADTQRKLRFVSELINNMNGLPLSDEERAKMVRTMIEQHASDEEIVTKVGMALKDIRQLREEYRAAVRLTNIGVNPEEANMSRRTLRAFGRTKVMQLDDDTYRNVAHLTNDAGLKATEVKALATSLAEAGSEEMRRERLARERQAREPQITARQHGQESVARTRQLRTRLEFLLKYPLTAFVERNPESVDEYLELLTRAQDVLREIRTLHGGRPVMPAPLGREAPPATH